MQLCTRVDEIVRTLETLGIQTSEREVNKIVRVLLSDYDVERPKIIYRTGISRFDIEQVVIDRQDIFAAGGDPQPAAIIS